MIALPVQVFIRAVWLWMSKQDVNTSQRHIPDYKAPPLRWPFLGLWVFLLCALIAVLEYGLHVLPVAEHRTAIPNDYFSYQKPGPVSADNRKLVQPVKTLDAAYFLPIPSVRMPMTQTTLSSFGLDKLDTQAPTTYSYTLGPQGTTRYTVNRRGSLITDSSAFVGDGPSPVYMTFAAQWTDTPSGTKSPVPYLEETPDMCTYHMSYIWLTNKVTPCLIVWTAENIFETSSYECATNFNSFDTATFQVSIWNPPFEITPDTPEWLQSSCTHPTPPATTNSHPPKPTAGTNGIFRFNITTAGIIAIFVYEYDPLDEESQEPGKYTTSDSPSPADSGLGSLLTSTASNEIATEKVLNSSNSQAVQVSLSKVSDAGASPSAFSFTGEQTTMTTIVSTILTAATPFSSPINIGPVTVMEISKVITIAGSFTTALSGGPHGYITAFTKLIPLAPVWSVPDHILMTNSLGEVTSTREKLNDNFIQSSIISTVLDAGGSPIATIITNQPVASSLTTLVDFKNSPTKTLTAFPAYPTVYTAKPASVRLAGPIEVLIAFFVPVLITAVLSIPIQIIDSELKLLLPYKGLTRLGGSTAEYSLCMETGGISGRINGVRLLWRFKDPISFVSDLVVVCSMFLVPLSSEVIGLKLRGSCEKDKLQGCFLTLAAFRRAIRGAEALLIITALLTLFLAFLLHRWRSGIATHPGTIAAMASLLQGQEIKSLLRSIEPLKREKSIQQRHLVDALGAKYFSLRCSNGSILHSDYGIRLENDRLAWSQDVPSDMESTTQLIRPSPPPHDPAKPLNQTQYLYHQPRSQRITQAVFLALLCGLLALILYYENTGFETPFERFMNSQEFGVRFLFSGLGVAVSFFWEHLFSRVATMNLLRQMAQRPQTAQRSILTPKSATVFTGFVRAVLCHDIITAAVALAGILGKFTPILLSNIPFEASQTWIAHLVIARLTTAVLVFMIVVVLLQSLCVKWPYVPIRPDTLCAQMLYLCDSQLLRDFEGMGELGQKERDKRITSMGRMYRFGLITGVSGRRRLGIDYAGQDQHGIKLQRLKRSGFNSAETTPQTK